MPYCPGHPSSMQRLAHAPAAWHNPQAAQQGFDPLTLSAQHKQTSSYRCCLDLLRPNKAPSFSQVGHACIHICISATGNAATIARRSQQAVCEQ